MVRLSQTAVLIPIDVQQAFDEPSWGARNNPAMEANGLRLLDAWRASGRRIVHVKHNSVEPGSTLRPGRPGNGFKPGFAPQGQEPLVEKTVNSAFIGTDLQARLEGAGHRQLVFFGITSDMCVSTSVRMAANLGFEAYVAGDACATFGQVAPDGAAVDAETIHRVHLTTLNTEFAKVLNTDEVIARLD
ncbi:MAG: cysteine hydrolase family protein [Kiloniellales bacterium]